MTMFTIRKTFEISGAHHLLLSYTSKCERTHGHNWIITIECKSETLDKNGMVLDFTRIKDEIHGTLDHQNLNDIFKFNPTAENIAKWIADRMAFCLQGPGKIKITVKESEGNEAIYEREK